MTEAVAFEWDTAKAASNLDKHGIPFEEAIAVFVDPLKSDFDVSRPQDREVRRKVVGAIGRRLFTVVYTQRGEINRVISARPANPQEARRYGDRQIHAGSGEPS